MTKEQIAAVLKRVQAWPEERQQELAAIAVEIEAEIKGEPYDPTPEELAGIDRGLQDIAEGRIASEAEVASALAKFRRR